MAYNMPRLMLLPIDCGRCYSHFVYIYIQADVIACWMWQMLLPLYCLIECING